MTSACVKNPIWEGGSDADSVKNSAVCDFGVNSLEFRGNIKYSNESTIKSEIRGNWTAFREAGSGVIVAQILRLFIH
jgi:hypothetical protein